MGATSPSAAVSDDLALRLRVESLYADYAQAIDDDRLEEWPDFFLADGRYRVTTRENHDRGLALAVMYCAGRGMMADRISALRVANIYEPHVYCHLNSGIRVLERDGREIAARANFAVLRTMPEGQTTIFACGRMLDRIVDEDGRLLFRERVVVLDSRQVDTLLVIPL